MSTPILPFAVWPAGSQQARIPANDNSLRQQMLHGLVISDAVTAQPGSPTEGDIYILAATHTGAQWAGFDEDDLVIFSGGTWYAVAPVDGNIVNLAGALYQYDSGWVAVGGAPGGSGTVTIITISGAAATHDLDPGDAGSMHRFTGTGAKVLAIDTADGFAAGEIYHVCNRAASGNVTLTPTGVTLNAPKAGSLVLEPDDTVSIHFVSSSVADVFGSTQ